METLIVILALPRWILETKGHPQGVPLRDTPLNDIIAYSSYPVTTVTCPPAHNRTLEGECCGDDGYVDRISSVAGKKVLTHVLS